MVAKENGVKGSFAMVDFKIDSKTKAERKRCLQIVAAYRQQLQSYSWPKKLLPADRIAAKTIVSLLELENRIKHPDTSSIGEFSEADMTKAEAIIAELSHNPFEE